MNKEFEIVIGHNPDDYVWIRPVRINLKLDYPIIHIRDEISVQVDPAESFFGYFFEKYYNHNICFNRYINGSDRNPGDVGFDWYFRSHIFPYHNVKDMLKEMSDFADKLEKNYLDPEISHIVRHFCFCYACGTPDKCQSTDVWHCFFDDPEYIDQRQKIAVSYYRRFIKELTGIMERHPETEYMEIHTP